MAALVSRILRIPIQIGTVVCWTKNYFGHLTCVANTEKMSDLKGDEVDMMCSCIQTDATAFIKIKLYA